MKTRPFLLLALSAGVAIGVSLVASIAPSSPDRRDLESPARRDLGQYFALLRSSPERPHTTAERSDVNNIRVVDPNAQPMITQLASRRTGLWAVVTENQLCLTESRGAACETWEDVTRRGVILGTFRPPDQHHPRPYSFRLQGFVPDHVRRALLVIGHRRIVAKVSHNLFAVEGNQPAHLLRLLRN